MPYLASSPFACTRCHHQDWQHRTSSCTGGPGYCRCAAAVPPVLPEPHEVAAASVVTSWHCPFCGDDQEVWGEGAVGSWMECEHCGKEAYLADTDEAHSREGGLPPIEQNPAAPTSARDVSAAR